jgi:hypothetical protein
MSGYDSEGKPSLQQIEASPQAPTLLTKESHWLEHEQKVTHVSRDQPSRLDDSAVNLLQSTLLGPHLEHRCVLLAAICL